MKEGKPWRGWTRDEGPKGRGSACGKSAGCISHLLYLHLPVLSFQDALPSEILLFGSQIFEIL